MQSLILFPRVVTCGWGQVHCAYRIYGMHMMGVATGVLSKAWLVSLPLFIATFIATAVGVVNGLSSMRRDVRKSLHPDPDVAALIDKEIDIAEFARRRALAAEQRSAEEPQSDKR